MCRYGGDEFVGILPQTDQEGGLMVAERIQELFRMLEFPFGGRPVTLSLGLATLKASGSSDLKGLLEAADAALYRVKARGRDGIAV
jgi:diguanylate cyclase (GGDEF)-like protein